MKAKVVAKLRELEHDVEDVGTQDAESVDYPDFAADVARAVSEGAVDRGILICGAGIGMAMAANKFPRVRAAVVHDLFTAEVSRTHNDANVLCVGARVLADDEALVIVEKWMSLDAEGGRHARRVNKIARIENHLRSEAGSNSSP
jgi:ribose 5-phosphate isomerase B